MPSGKFYFLGNEKWTARNKLLTRIIRLFYSCYLQATRQEYRIHSRCRSDLCFVWIAWINNRLFFIILVSLDKFNKIKFTKNVRDLTKDWTKIASISVNHSNHYTRSVYVWDHKWILVHAGYLCPLLNYLTRYKCLH